VGGGGLGFGEGFAANATALKRTAAKRLSKLKLTPNLPKMHQPFAEGYVHATMKYPPEEQRRNFCV
jgi:hypothetical protein